MLPAPWAVWCEGKRFRESFSEDSVLVQLGYSNIGWLEGFLAGGQSHLWKGLCLWVWASRDD